MMAEEESMVDLAEIEGFAIAAKLHAAIDDMAAKGGVSSALSVILALGHMQGEIIARCVDRKQHRLYMRCADDVRRTALSPTDPRGSR